MQNDDVSSTPYSANGDLVVVRFLRLYMSRSVAVIGYKYDVVDIGGIVEDGKNSSSVSVIGGIVEEGKISSSSVVVVSTGGDEE